MIETNEGCSLIERKLEGRCKVNEEVGGERAKYEYVDGFN